ncbi:MAG: DUF87 domain-containing protein [Oscillospiraceae bacterium]|nr:DUF87 domain-containing protein [Oscillospiraceae bacterium]
MAKKAKKETKETVSDSSRVGWLIASILLAVLIFFTITKMGLFGVISSNILTYILGSLYTVPILTLFSYGIYALFFKDRYPASIRIVIGLVVLNITVILLYAYILNDVVNFARLSAYISDNFKAVFSKEILPKSGGVLGYFLYVVFSTLTSRQGTLIIIIVAMIIAAILIIPGGVYRSIYDDTRNGISSKREEFKKRRAEEKAAAARAEEERRARLAEEIARLAEEEEAQRKKQEELEAAKKAQEEEYIEIEVEEPITVPHEHDYVLSKSPTFINLNDKEIYGTRKRKKKVKKNSVEQTPEQVKDEIVSEDKPRTLRAKKGNSHYHLPKPYEDFLDASTSSTSTVNKTSAAVKGEKVIEILSNFGIEATLLNTYIGPSVTKFEIKPDSSVKINKIMNISDNIKMELAAKDIRIEAPIPGRSAVGIEIPNVEPIPVRMLDLMKAIPADKRKIELLFALGKDLMGKPVYCDLTKMPHLLIAGATGSGKSVCINSIIISFLLRTNPDNVKLVLVDPKKVEFTSYKDIPHLLWPIIDDAQMASNMLKKIVVLMEERYDAFATAGVRNIDGFNSFVEEYNQNLKEGEEPMKRLPYMVVIIDELADLMAIAGKDVELSIQRITQLARASGIHLIVATQRPSTDVITGLIKSNIPSRISFAVASSIDSRTILDQTGAERLLGNGDMLYYPQGETAPIRMQGVYVTDREINKITKYIKAQAKPDYEDSYFEFLTNMNGTTVMSANSVNADSQDSLYDDVVEFVRAQQKASTSLLQRRFGIGYNRAARLIDTLEDRGIIGPANGSKPREVYLKEDEDE